MTKTLVTQVSNADITIWTALRNSNEYRLEQYIRTKAGNYVYVGSSVQLVLAGIMFQFGYGSVIYILGVCVIIYMIFYILKRRRRQIEIMKRINQLKENQIKRKERTDGPRF